MNILQINSSARRVQDGQGSFSTRLANELVEALQQTQDGVQLQVLDLGLAPHPALDEAALQALFTPAEQRSAAQAERAALDMALIEQVRASDVLVLAVPMINFGVPTQLKNWIDAIAKAGVTFRYTANGPEGLLTGKKVYVVLTRGGIYRGQPADTMVPYLKTVLGFLGMTDVSFVYAEGLAMGPESEARALASARAEIQQLLQPLAQPNPAEPATV
jgi:FMN-dependent NADH-azoreductase